MRISPASYLLSKKEFKGLDPNVQNLPVQKAITGQVGLPMSYDNEPLSPQNNTSQTKKQNTDIESISSPSKNPLPYIQQNMVEEDPNQVDEQEGEIGDLFDI